MFNETTPPALKTSRGETILLVEDNLSVRTLIEYVLTDLGYHVLAVGDTGDAEALARNLARPIHLMVLDVHLSSHNGYDLARRLLAVRANCSVLFVSGLTEMSLTYDRTVPAASRFLTKPFSPQTLAITIHDLLNVGMPRSRIV